MSEIKEITMEYKQWWNGLDFDCCTSVEVDSDRSVGTNTIQPSNTVCHVMFHRVSICVRRFDFSLETQKCNS